MRRIRRSDAARQEKLDGRLYAAAARGAVSQVRGHLGEGARLVTTGPLGSPLHAAAAGGALDVVLVLLEAGAPTNLLGETNYSPLHLAIRHDHSAVVVALLNHGASPDVLSRFERRCPLHLAASWGRVAVVELLLHKGAAVDSRDLYGQTPLHVAARLGHLQVISDLLAGGANPDLYDQEGWSAMHYASCGGHTDVVRLLAASRGQVDQQNKYGRTPLHWACEKGQVGTVEVLLSLGADLTIKDRLDKRPVDVAKGAAVKEIIKLYEANLATDEEDGGPITQNVALKMTLKPFVRHVSRVESVHPMALDDDSVSEASSDSSVMSPNYENALKTMFGSDILTLINECFRLSSGVAADERRAARHKYKQFLVAVGSLLSITSTQADHLYTTVASALQHKSHVAEVLKVVFEKLQVVEDTLADFQREIAAEVRTLTSNFRKVIQECAQPTLERPPALQLETPVETRAALLRQGRLLGQVGVLVSKHPDLWRDLAPHLYPDETLDCTTGLVLDLEARCETEEEQACELLFEWAAQHPGDTEMVREDLLRALQEVGGEEVQEAVRALVAQHHQPVPRLELHLGPECPSGGSEVNSSTLSVQTDMNEGCSDC